MHYAQFQLETSVRDKRKKPEHDQNDHVPDQIIIDSPTANAEKLFAVALGRISGLPAENLNKMAF